MRTKLEILRRYAFLFGGLLVNATGIVLMTKSCLGTSPIAAIPYVLSLQYFPSLGTFTFLLYAVMFLIQLIILGKNVTRKDFLQIPLSIIFSIFIDIIVSLVAHIEPANYAVMMGWLLLGCVLRALGVSMQVTADVAMLSGEAFMSTIAKYTKKDFSLIKFICDIVMVSTAIALSYRFTGSLSGIREGTIISVVIIAPVTRVFNKRLLKYNRRFPMDSGAYTIKRHYKNESEGLIITISSQSGSGGHRIGKLLSDRLDLPLYDNDMVELVANEGGFSEDYVRKHIGRLYNNRLWEFLAENYKYTGFSVDNYTELFEAQKRVIERLGRGGSCIIVGYCSEYLLRNRDNVFSVYIHANEEAKQKFLEKTYKVNSEKALEIMHTHDRDRSVYLKHFTGADWEDSDRFSLSIDSSMLGIEETAVIISDVIKKREKVK